MYKTPVKIVSTFVGPERQLTVPWLFRVFQDAAIGDVEQIPGYTISETSANDLLWVFTRVHLHVERLPDYLEEVEFMTYPLGKKAFMFPRAGKLIDKAGKEIAVFSSIWVMINQKTRSLEFRPPLPDINQSEYGLVKEPGKVIPQPCQKRAQRKIGYGDLDLNGHLNNVRYVEMILDLNPASFHKENVVQDMWINYHSEIRDGEVVDLYSDEQVTYVKGTVGDRLCFEAKILYKKRI